MKIRPILGSLKGFYKETILAPLFVIIDTLLFSQIPFIIARLIDNGINAGDKEYIINTGIQLLLVTLMMTVTGVLGGVFTAKGATGFSKNLRHNLFYKIEDYSFSNLDKFSSSSLIVRLTTDVQRLQNVYQMSIRGAFRALSSIIFAIYMSYIISPKLSMTFLFAVPILVTLLIVIIKLAFPRFEKVFKEIDNLNRVVKENLDGIRVVKAYVQNEYEVKKFKERSSLLEKLYVNAYKLMVSVMPIMLFCVFAITIVIVFLGSKMVISTELTTGELVSLVSYTSMALFGLIMFSGVFVMAIVASPSIKRVVEVLEEVPDIKDEKNPITELNNADIEFKDVSFSYLKRDDKLCLENINLKINQGEKIGIIGSTGSSKTSLVNLLPRLYDVQSGSIEIGGIDVRKYSLETLRNNISYALQKSVLFSGTIKENLLWGKNNASEEEMIQACKIAQIHDFIMAKEGNYNYKIERGGVNVSGGQRQRLAIARALIKSPKILILDDSTSAVDMSTEASINKGLSEKLPNTTKIIIAQRISSIENCDKIIVLDEGKIVGLGKHEDLLATNNIYQEVYYTQKKEVGDASV
ncbi:MAG: ABC transporter ATP-binding protein [Sphaerochaetaceae bacterium]|nr:ABC transporter ATP-binding protein [Sphaerochaetaceae bacterium]MDC7250879.1 ABC transporter ATP-binding protein [Sphaerochaetaceae bacterium]